ncbi:MAG: hypothetical protein IPG48_04840 [Saprospiraceae bacterium]|nr:hypothetical protein [Saprospiraceae bacterium]
MEYPKDIKFKPDFRSLILVWAFAESGIGGFLHALRLPFTGILVGGIAVICITLIGYYKFENKNSILEAMSIVLLTKLAISPHSPWQAYVAVIFQGYLGYLIFKSNQFFSLKVLIFAIISLLESAFQKVLIAFLVFGKEFMSSIDQAAISIANALGFSSDISIVKTVFGVYILAHLLAGIAIGIWLPKIPSQLNLLIKNMPEPENYEKYSSQIIKRKSKVIFSSLAIFIGILLLLKWILPEVKGIELIWIFFRSILISVMLIFLIGPLIRKFIKNKWTVNKDNEEMFQTTIARIPEFSQKAICWIQYVNKYYVGISKVKYLVLGLLVISGTSENENG